MKRTVFIIGGIGIVLLLVSIWMYILVTGTTSDTVTFSDLDFDNTDTEVVPAFTPEPEPVVDVESNDRLRQLTTKPVAGFAEVQLAINSPRTINYVESGTGHIFAIDLTTGEEERVSATTIPLTYKAVLTPNGRHTLLQSDSGARASFSIGTLSTTSDQLSNFKLNEDVADFVATTDNELLYSVETGSQLVVKAYRPTDNTTRILFTVPFREAAISWHHTTAGPHIVYPKASSRLEGYVYTYTNGVGVRAAASGYGLSAVGSSAGVIYGSRIDDQYTTHYVATGEVIGSTAPVTMIPEKCRFTRVDATVALCGAELREFSYLTPDPWYQGAESMDDSLWEYDVERFAARLLVDPESVTGRTVDITRPMFGTDDNNLYFQNKTDQTLWMYEYIPNSVTN